jgi:hypothetical protein
MKIQHWVVSGAIGLGVALGAGSGARVWLRRATSLAAGRPVGRAAADLLRGLNQDGH